MNELDKGLDISMRGVAARRALAVFRRQVKAWGVAMPTIKPLVLDFGIGEYEKTGLIEYWIANEARAGYCGKYLFVFDGQTCPEHRHRKKHETFFVVKGQVRMRCGGRSRVMKEGDVLPVAPGRKHSFTGIGPALLLELSMPCEIADNYFTNRDIPIGGNAACGGRS
ncbi:MAG: D-lyxose/D-mannose family sugar isomerase [bacterium]